MYLGTLGDGIVDEALVMLHLPDTHANTTRRARPSALLFKAFLPVHHLGREFDEIDGPVAGPTVVWPRQERRDLAREVGRLEDARDDAGDLRAVRGGGVAT